MNKCFPRVLCVFLKFAIENNENDYFDLKEGRWRIFLTVSSGMMFFIELIFLYCFINIKHNSKLIDIQFLSIFIHALIIVPWYLIVNSVYIFNLLFCILVIYEQLLKHFMFVVEHHDHSIFLSCTGNIFTHGPS